MAQAAERAAVEADCKYLFFPTDAAQGARDFFANFRDFFNSSTFASNMQITYMLQGGI